DRVAFPRCPSRIVCVHPGKMGRTPNQRRSGVHTDAVRGAFGIINRDGAENLSEGAPLVVNDSCVDARTSQRRKFLANNTKPELRVRSVTVGSVFAVDAIGQGAIALEARKRKE